MQKRYVKASAMFERIVTNIVCLRLLNHFIKTLSNEFWAKYYPRRRSRTYMLIAKQLKFVLWVFLSSKLQLNKAKINFLPCLFIHHNPLRTSIFCYLICLCTE